MHRSGYLAIFVPTTTTTTTDIQTDYFTPAVHAHRVKITLKLCNIWKHNKKQHEISHDTKEWAKFQKFFGNSHMKQKFCPFHVIFHNLLPIMFPFDTQETCYFCCVLIMSSCKKKLAKLSSAHAYV